MTKVPADGPQCVTYQNQPRICLPGDRTDLLCDQFTKGQYNRWIAVFKPHAGLEKKPKLQPPTEWAGRDVFDTPA